ncbi:4-(cytidine 5'-diphospho)-2-C-methyl-D-erythritol kinase [Yimella sp. cx-51]|uniref:4-(cytidine 5'-diphospho)-2-C-methyl-D-erythritol kinase n=1 Tax=Yimella sp. cx-51 TaxID=2770551 RepID=UPI00165DD9F7|nr:4-(cytidine 5'-diphospho)-2-C-methyl-D-erythritol kinase [Yimella sp. cx-51]MBC9956189.1 4-(cytidine 5'-diphospho)-2-C-methyl-D-erythritol kinase [Yimella sp. cx-51]QTH38660.1 4-(cytidine 5'-diphospho)-2-C-methyl-D-erythritol kinase [Yimella sp. cx-51]
MAAIDEGVTVRVPAKVNLSLAVGPLDEDGYHGLATVFHAVDLTDDIHVRPSKQWECTITGPYADKVPTDGANLAMQVAHRLAQECYEAGPVSMTIDKSIPVAGGMAGGSADAAAAIIAIDQLFDLQLTKLDHLDLARDLGSDVPFALTGGTALGSGRGDELAPVLATGRYEWVFALQHEGLSTPAVYAEFDRLNKRRKPRRLEAPEEILTALRTGDPYELAGAMFNDLQEAAISLMPRLQDTIDVGLSQGALGAIVSGSGPTVAFLCADRAAALDLMVGLTACKVADDVVSASGPHPGARVVPNNRLT